MGCAQSTAVEEKPSAAAPAAEPEPAAEDVAPPASAPEPKPMPQVFAIMRNGHEVIRGAQRDLKELIEAGNFDASLDLWEKHNKWMFIHMTMEEGNGSEGSPKGMFKVLNEAFEGCADEAGLGELHTSLQEKESALAHAFEEKDMDKISTAFAAYDEENLAHLLKEENVMMPKVAEMRKGGHDVKKLMLEEILPLVVNRDDFEFFVKFANEILEKHAEGQPRVRVFDHALWAVATTEQWSVWNAWIKESVTPETYQEVQNAIGD